MNALRILKNDKRMMSSKEICELTSKPHKNTSRLIKSLIDKELIRSAQFEHIFLEDSYGRKQPAYKLDKTASILVVAQQSPEFTSKMIERWQELESQQTQPKKLSRVELATNWLEAEKKVEALEAQALVDKPKVVVYNSLAKRERDVKTTVLAKQLGISAVKLNKWMKDSDIKFKYDDLPKAGYVEWFNVIAGVSDAGHEYSQCLITPLGMIEITKLWNSQHSQSLTK